MGEDSIRCQTLGLLELPDELLLDIACRLRGGNDLQTAFSSCRKLHDVMVPRIGSAFVELRKADADHGLEDGPAQLQVSTVANQIARALVQGMENEACVNPSKSILHSYRTRRLVSIHEHPLMSMAATKF